MSAISRSWAACMQCALPLLAPLGRTGFNGAIWPRFGYIDLEHEQLLFQCILFCLMMIFVVDTCSNHGEKT